MSIEHITRWIRKDSPELTKSLAILHSDHPPQYIDEILLGASRSTRKAIREAHLPKHIELLSTTLNSAKFDPAETILPARYIALHEQIMLRVNATDPLRDLSREAYKRTLALESSIACGFHSGASACMALEHEALQLRAAAENPEPSAAVTVTRAASGDLDISFASDPSPTERIEIGFGWPAPAVLMLYPRLLTVGY